MGRSAAAGAGGAAPPTRAPARAPRAQEFRALLRSPSLHVLLTHGGAELGAGALPLGQRSFLQEVSLAWPGGRARLLFWLNMHADGVWLVRNFEAR